MIWAISRQNGKARTGVSSIFGNDGLRSWSLFYFFIDFFIFYFFLLYNIGLVLPYINMNPPWVYTCSPSWSPSHLPSHTIPLGHPSAPAPSILYHASNLEWRLVSHILYMFQCHSPNHPTLALSHRVQNTVLYICVSFAVSLWGYCYHLSKFHIYALVYCIGVFLSGLLHSV